MSRDQAAAAREGGGRGPVISAMPPFLPGAPGDPSPQQSAGFSLGLGVLAWLGPV